MMLLTFFLSLAPVAVVLLRTTPIYADIVDYINVTIKISICGNKIIEGGEDCEGDDLNGETCLSLGYASGDLSCDIACTFDTSNCVAPTPTPSPTPTPTSAPATTSVSTATSAETPTATPTPTSTPVLVPVPPLPQVVALFDPDGSGKIEITEVFNAVKIWVDEWRSALLKEVAEARGETPKKKEPRKCDINRDNHCDLRDFSILLYYVG